MVSIRLSALVALLVLAAACVPVTTTTTRARVLCTSQSSPNAYVAYVDTPSGDSEVVTFTANNSAAVDAKVAQLEVTGDVVAVSPDQSVSALAVNPNNDPYYSKQWGNITPTPVGYVATKAEFTTAWATQDGTGLTVAVVDTGVKADHPDLSGRVSSLRRDFAVTDEPAGVEGAATDPHGHGTHVAGIIAAADNTIGVVGGAPQSTILAVRVLNSCGSGEISAVVRGINWAVANGAKIINLSLGTTGNSSVLEAAVNDAVAAGVVVVAAAGNSSGSAPSYPGAYLNAIGVGAIEESGAIADYSTRGVSVDIAAPGSTILSTLNTGDYGSKSGTSMATPVVAASVALLLQKCPGLTPGAVRDRLRATMSAPISGFAAAPNQVGLVKPGALIAAPC